MNKRQEQIDNIIMQMVAGKVYVDDAGDVNVTQRFHKLICGLIKNTRTTFASDWDIEVIKSEAISSFYEAMISTAEYMHLEDGEITLKNDDFIKVSYTYAVKKMKQHLIPHYKKGEHKFVSEELGKETEPGTNTYDESLSKLATEDFVAEKESELLQYIRCKKDLLTKKQRQFLRTGYVITRKKDVETARRMKRRIENNVNKSLDNHTVKEGLIMYNNDIIDLILNAKDFRKEYDVHKDKDFIIDAIVDNVDAETRKAFNLGSDDPEVIKKMRIGLRRGKDFKIYK